MVLWGDLFQQEKVFLLILSPLVRLPGMFIDPDPIK